MTTLIPNFFIVGAPRCGTTAMYEYLRAHPQIFMPAEVKEPHHFAPGMAMPSVKPYAERSAYLSLFAQAGDARRIGEASTHYLAAPGAAQAIYAFNPAAKIIIMLRSPLELLHSLYHHRVRYAVETNPTFEAALQADTDSREPVWQYRIYTRFAAQVQHYWQVFGREAVHIIIFDDFKRDTAAIYRQTLEFLDVDTDFQPDFAPANEHRAVRLPLVRRLVKNQSRWYRRVRDAVRPLVPAAVRRSVNRNIDRLTLTEAPRPPISPALRQQLQQEFLPQIEQLSDLLGRDLTHWCRDELSGS
jgi:hypothetical protein